MRLPLLCVDDEPRVLESLENHLSLEYEVTLASSGQDGLAALAKRPHAVVISDMRMPVMNGATFLSRVRAEYPDTVRMLLTGHSDLSDASAAVNQGHLFRLLIKPCQTQVLLAAIADAYRQQELQLVERTLLEQTLHGAVTVLTDILGLVHPLAFGRATRVAAIVKHAAAKLQLADAWQVELAAMLSQLGCITFDAELIERIHAGTLTPEDEVTYQGHPATARRMLERIPRLEVVAELVGDQLTCTTEHGSDTARLGCELIRMALMVDHEWIATRRFDAAVVNVMGKGTWTPAVVAAVRSHQAQANRRVVRVHGKDLGADMILEADATSPRGELWMTRGTTLTSVAARRLRALSERGLLAEPLLVALQMV